jgi:hypothetical protein
MAVRAVTKRLRVAAAYESSTYTPRRLVAANVAT